MRTTLCLLMLLAVGCGRKDERAVGIDDRRPRSPAADVEEQAKPTGASRLAEDVLKEMDRLAAESDHNPELKAALARLDAEYTARRNKYGYQAAAEWFLQHVQGKTADQVIAEFGPIKPN